MKSGRASRGGPGVAGVDQRCRPQGRYCLVSSKHRNPKLNSQSTSPGTISPTSPLFLVIFSDTRRIAFSTSFTAMGCEGVSRCGLSRRARSCDEIVGIGASAGMVVVEDPGTVPASANGRGLGFLVLAYDYVLQRSVPRPRHDPSD